MISLIVACDSEYGIGKDGTMPWRFPADFKYFKDRTTGHPMIAGRKNFDDMGILPGRQTIVLTRDEQYSHKNKNVYTANDIFQAVEKAKWIHSNHTCHSDQKQVISYSKFFKFFQNIFIFFKNFLNFRNGSDSPWNESTSGTEVGSDEIFIVGGAQVYELALTSGLVDRIYLTHITRASYDCDTFFQDHLLQPYKEIARTVRYADDANPERLEFIVYELRQPGDFLVDGKPQ